MATELNTYLYEFTKTHSPEELRKEILRHFYVDMQNWIEQGKPSRGQFDFAKEVGLCYNLRQWVRKLRIVRYELLALQELTQSFREAGLDTVYPFNRGPGAYDDDEIFGNHYNNPARLNWIKKHSSHAYKLVTPRKEES